jgi:heme/copper-type cytochrome/quinol oxidase subunit 3
LRPGPFLDFFLGSLVEVKAEKTALLGMLLFVAAEAMFFGGLFSAFLVFRVQQASWPPPGQPRLPVASTAFNTALFLVSAFTLQGALASSRRKGTPGLAPFLAATAFLGGSFLALQGREWLRLLDFGLRLSSSVYGGLFYVLVGVHGLHVLGALTVLLVILVKAWQGGYGPDRNLGLRLFRIYWFFVVGIWPLLYWLVYLA